MDRWLDYQSHTLVIDVIGTLEIEAGLRAVLIWARHADVVTDLVGTLDVEAGLAAIAPTTTDQIKVEETEYDAVLLEFLQAAASWNPSTCLAARTHPIFNLISFDNRPQPCS